MTRWTLSSLILIFLVSNYLSFQAGQTVRYYDKAPSQTGTSRSGARVYGVNQRLTYTPSRLDFGVITDLEPRYRDVAFHNPGSEAVTIKRIKAGCGCTSARLLGDKTIPPGGQGRLRVEVQPALASPQLSASVSIEYEGLAEVDRLLVSGEVLKP